GNLLLYPYWSCKSHEENLPKHGNPSKIESIKYQDYQWQICGDLKVVAILLGMQRGFTKFCCFLCEWDSRDRASHYIRSLYPWTKKCSLQRSCGCRKHLKNHFAPTTY
ncbi:unnamed protein product, partial [Nezara viridula]